MIVPIVTAGAGVVAGLLLGGCSSGGEDLSRELLQRNAALENQVAAGQNTLTGMAVACVILAGGLGVSLFANRRTRGGKKRKA